MGEIVIAPVTQEDMALLDGALRALAADIGDVFTSGQEALADAICGPGASCLALLASRNGVPVGATVAAPMFSTIRGGMGLFVSDLWVAKPERGKGLARRLLAEVLREGARRDAGHFLKLTVYHDNPGARAVYDRLGFDVSQGETNMVLTGGALETLKETA